MTYKILAPNYYSRFDRVTRSLSKGRICANFGCSEGYYDRFLLRRFKHVVGIDVNLNDLLVAKARNPSVLYIAASVAAMPFKKNVFDEAICVDVIEHIKDDRKALREMSRTIKKKSSLIITVPNENFPFTYDPINRVLAFFGRNVKFPIGLWGFGHQRLYSEDGLSRQLNSSGFDVLKVERMLHFFCGIFENYYIVNILQPLTKHDRLNIDKFYSENRKKPILIDKNPPVFLTKTRDMIIRIDSALFRNSRRSLGLLVVAEKK